MEVVRHHFSTIDSTNAWAKKHADSFDPEKITLVTADCQSEGKGREKRTWVSTPNAGIYTTFSLFVKGNREAQSLTLLLAISAGQVIQACGFEPWIKWPNDLQINGKKVGGVLSETKWVGDRLCLLAGIGINVNHSLEELQEIDQPATSLSLESKKILNKEEILQKLSKKFIQNIEFFNQSGFLSFSSFFEKNMEESFSSQSFHM